MESGKSLARWRYELNNEAKSTWLRFYADQLGVQCSSPPRLYKALKNYGFWPLFEAIIASTEKDLNGDPLNYVVKVAQVKWKEGQEEEQGAEDYLKVIEAAKKKSAEESKALAKKLEKIDG